MRIILETKKVMTQWTKLNGKAVENSLCLSYDPEWGTYRHGETPLSGWWRLTYRWKIVLHDNISWYATHHPRIGHLFREHPCLASPASIWICKGCHQLLVLHNMPEKLKQTLEILHPQENSGSSYLPYIDGIQGHLRSPLVQKIWVPQQVATKWATESPQQKSS